MASHNVNMQNTLFAKIKPYRFRILAGLLFCVFLISTWFVFHQKPHFPEVLHITLQEQFRNIVQKKLAEQKPEARNLQFQRLSTEGTKSDQIIAVFQYSFDDSEGVSFSVSGKAIMNRKSIDPERNHDLWTVDHIKTSNTNLEFKEPITLFSGAVKNKPDAKESSEEEMLTDTSEDEKEEIDKKEKILQEDTKPLKKEVTQEQKDKTEDQKPIEKEIPEESQTDKQKTTEENKPDKTDQETKPSEKDEVKPTDKTQNPSSE